MFSLGLWHLHDLHGRKRDMKLNIRDHLKAARMKQAALAEAADITPGFLSEILSGKKQPSVETLQAIAAALKVSVADLVADPPQDAVKTIGFAEPEAEPFEPETSTSLQKALSALASACKHAETYLIRKSDASLALCAGDVLVIDLDAPLEPGALVIATIADADSGEATTVVRRYVPGWLFGSGDPVRTDDDKTSVGVLGSVRSMIRPASKG